MSNGQHPSSCVELEVFRRDPRTVLQATNGGPLAVLDGGGVPLFYCLSPNVFGATLDGIDTLEAMVAIEQRRSEREIAVPWDTL